ncbi:DUF2934 domain-containing protein [Nitrosomonas oligotropha]|uniref:DUF2934 domain-containing protein n=1 Tax=Nitrosomonas oligotropha TaxID=42354 RepID=A0A1H8TPN2_9PROT|nr:DUF2934 domain-containing protein [Nitrosomonas oligotropha]SDX34003.1 Protein of unknown function [Nitrosomonas oligotropha]SEO92827.1 Protein of unknown function [Nitrosomonas oligotropha]
MPSKVSEGETRKSGTRLSKSEERILANQVLNPVKSVDRQEMIATAAYFRAEKRGFTGNETDALRDWLEAEREVDNELDMLDSSSIDFQFLTIKE